MEHLTPRGNEPTPDGKSVFAKLAAGTTVTDTELEAAFGQEWRDEIGKHPDGTPGKITKALGGKTLRIVYSAKADKIIFVTQLAANYYLEEN